MNTNKRGRRLVSLLVAFVMTAGLFAVLPELASPETAYANNFGTDGQTITPAAGRTDYITANGTYTLAAGSYTNYTLIVNTGVTATLNVAGTTTINNSGSSSYNKSAISLSGTAKLTLNVTGTLNAYGSPGTQGEDPISRAPKGGAGGYAAISVPSTSVLRISGTGSLYAYGGDAADGTDNVGDVDIGSGGAGGAGAGIGGNGGAGGFGKLTSSSPSISDAQGKTGGSAGKVYVIDSVKVYAYGGSGGSGGDGSNSSGVLVGMAGGSGGGYPAAGIGGGGAGGGGGSNTGGGGFSGGVHEHVTVLAADNGLSPIISLTTYGSGGGYFAWSVDSKSGAPIYETASVLGSGAIGGGGGYRIDGDGVYLPGAGADDSGGRGGQGGAGGSVYRTSSSTLKAYNGNYITTANSGASGNNWGANQTPIYAQLGISLDKMRAAKVREVKQRAGNSVSTELNAYKDSAAFSTTGYSSGAANASTLGIGSGAGYQESSNGSYAVVSVPGAPTSAKASAQSGSSSTNKTVKLTWGAPGSTGNLPVTEYLVMRGTTKVYSGKDLTFTDTGLKGGTAYTYNIYALNEVGQSTSYATATATAIDVPGTPELKPLDNSTAKQLKLSWSEPASNGSKVSKYRVYRKAEGESSFSLVNDTVTGTSYTDTNAASGKTYSYYVQAYNTGGWSGSSNTVSGKAKSVPTAPPLTAERGIRELKLSWPGSNLDGLALTKYVLTRTSDSKILYEGTNTSYTDSGLADNTEYSYSVYAVTAAGSGAAASVTSRTYGVPDAPTSLSSEMSEKDTVKLSWIDPNFTGDQEISGYEIKAYTDAAHNNEVTLPPNAVSAVTAESGRKHVYISSGLSRGGVYWFGVRAKNAVGTGEAGYTDVKLVTWNVPDPPTGVDAVASKTEEGLISLSWSAPGNDGGTPVTGYTVHIYEGESLLKDVEAHTSTSIEIRDLDMLKTYRFTVTAFNKVGESQESQAKEATVAGKPAAPEQVSAEAKSETEIELKWGAAAPNGNPVTEYIVEYREKGTESWTAYEGAELDGTARSCGVTGLKPYTEYEFKVHAKNSAGEGPESGAEAKTRRKPFAPELVRAEPTNRDGEVELSWTASELSEDASAPANGYNVYVKLGGELVKMNSEQIAAQERSYTVKGAGVLVNGTEYEFYVCGVNGEGDGDLSNMVKTSPRKPSGAPRELIAAVKSGTEVSLSWTEPEDLGGGAYEAESLYQVEVDYSQTAASSEGVSIAVEQTARTAVVSGLSKGESYSYRVYAVTAAGNGAAAESEVLTQWKDPSEPLNVKAEPTNESGELLVSFETPSDDGGSPVSGYTVFYRVKSEGGEYQSQQVSEAEGESHSVLLSGLTNGAVYEVKVSARNGSGEGPSSEAQEATPRTKPGAPVLDELRTGDSIATVPTVTVPDNGGGVTENYKIYVRVSGSGGEYVNTAEIPAVSGDVYKNLVVPGLTNGVSYEVYVTAVNEVGESGASETLSVMAGLPETPGHFKVEAGRNAAVTASYDAAEGNGSPILGYYIYTGGETDLGKYSDMTGDTSYTTYGEDSGELVTLSVAAYNQYGVSPQTESVTIGVGSPSIPELSNVILYSKDASAEEEGGKTGIDVVWNASNTNGNVISKYTVYLSELTEHGAETVQTFEITEGFSKEGQFTYNIPADSGKFEYGKRYKVEMTATNGGGESRRSEGWEFAFGVPQAPEQVQTKSGANSVELSWGKPSENGNPITAYKVYVNGSHEYTVTWKGTGPYTLVSKKESTGEEQESSDLYPDLERLKLMMGELVNGSEYRIEVSAVNGNGEGSRSAAVEEVPATQADMVRNITAKAVSSSGLELSWKSPYSNGGSSITDYKVTGYEVDAAGTRTGTVIGDDQIEKEPGAVTSAKVSGLEMGGYYEFEVYAVTKAGNGSAGKSNVARTFTRPDPPRITKLISGTSSDDVLPLTVEWEAPEYTGETEITGYDIYIAGYFKANKELISAEDRTFTISHDEDLARGETFEVTMVAHNSVGVSEQSEIQVVTMGTPPAPTNVKVEVGKNNLHITWSLENLLDSVVTGYRIYLDKPVIGKAKKNILGASATSADLSKLVAGTEVWVYVAAYNDIPGDGAYSEPVHVFIGAPTEPELTSVERGYEKLTLNWKEPATDNDAAVEKYVIYVDGEKTAEAGPGERSYELESLADGRKLEGGRSYKVEVSAVNANGESLRSQEVIESAWSKPGTPEVKENINVGAGEFSFEYSKPEGNGLEITGYRVYIDGEAVPEQSPSEPEGMYVELDAQAQSAHVYHVPDGVKEGIDPETKLEYTYGHLFYITALTRTPSGEELESEAPAKTEMEKVTTGIPETPEFAGAVPGNGRIVVSWNRVNGVGAEVEGYELSCYEDKNGTPKLVQKVTTSDTGYTLSEGLHNGTRYELRLRAYNAIGYSAYGSQISVTPGTPTAPEITSAAGMDSSVTIVWKPALSNVGMINKYKVYLDGKFLKEVMSSKLSATVADLNNGQEYSFEVSAVNSTGEGERSAPVKVIPGTKPGELKEVRYEVKDEQSIELTWDAPLDTGGLAIREYIVEGEGTIESNGSECRALVTGLEEGKTYTFTVRAVNAIGEGERTSTDPITTMSRPSNPVWIVGTSKNGQIIAKWEVPKNSGGTEVLGYNVYMAKTENGTAVEEPKKVNSELIQDLTYTISGVETGEIYAVSLRAVNRIGEGGSSDALNIEVIGMLAQEVPGKVNNLSVTEGNRMLTADWTAPNYDGNSAILKYKVYVGTVSNDLKEVAEVRGNVYTCNITNLANGSPLENGQMYYVAVRAVNGVDPAGGELCEPKSGTPTKINAPEPPEWPALDNEAGTAAYTVNSTGTEMTVSWTAELSDKVTYKVLVNRVMVAEGLKTTSYKLDVEAGTEYNIQVNAVNSASESASTFIRARSSLNIVKDPTKDYGEQYAEGKLANIDADYNGEEDNKIVYTSPSVPRDVSWSPNPKGKTITLQWKIPESDGNGVIKGYTAYVNGEAQPFMEVDHDGNPVYADTVPEEERTFSKGLASGAYQLKLPIQYGKAYTIQVSASNQTGESSKSGGLLVYIPATKEPTGLAASLENKTNVVLSWTAPNAENLYGYTLYVNSDRLTLGSGDYETATETDETTQKETTTVTYRYEGRINMDYVFRVSALYNGGDTESKVSEAVSASTKEVKPEAPVLTGTLAETPEASGRYQVELKWKSPSNLKPEEISYYTLYVNGEPYVEEGAETVKQIQGSSMIFFAESNTTYILRIAAQNGETEGEKSEKFAFTTVANEETPVPDNAPKQPGKPAVEYKKDANGNLIRGEANGTVRWTSAEPEEGYLIPTGYNVYINGIKVNDPLVNGNEYSYEFRPGVDYSIQIEPVNDDGVNAAVVGVRSEIEYTTAPADSYAEPGIPKNFKAEYVKDETAAEDAAVVGKIRISFDEEAENDHYILYQNGTALEGLEIRSGLELDAARETDYAFQLSAVKVYNKGEANEVTVEGKKTEPVSVSTKPDSGEEIIPTAPGKPAVTRSVSDGLSRVKVYWTAPERTADEVGEIVGYYVLSGGVRMKDDSGADAVVGAQSVNSYGEYQYELKDVTRVQEITVIAFKKLSGGGDVLGSESEVWKIDVNLNTTDEESYESDDPAVSENVANKDSDGDGKSDVVGKTIRVSGMVDAGGKQAKVTLYDQYDREVASQETAGSFAFEAPVNGAEAAEAAEPMALALSGGPKAYSGYTLRAYRNGYTYYEITGIDVTKVESIDAATMKIYGGDANGDGRINVDDKSIVTMRYGTSGEGIVGDINGDGVVNVDDLSIVTMNYGRQYTSLTYDNYSQVQ